MTKQFETQAVASLAAQALEVKEVASIRIERDNDKITEIEAEVIAFLAELNEQINQLEKS